MRPHRRGAEDQDVRRTEGKADVQGVLPVVELREERYLPPFERAFEPAYRRPRVELALEEEQIPIIEAGRHARPVGGGDLPGEVREVQPLLVGEEGHADELARVREAAEEGAVAGDGAPDVHEPFVMVEVPAGDRGDRCPVGQLPGAVDERAVLGLLYQYRPREADVPEGDVPRGGPDVAVAPQGRGADALDGIPFFVVARRGLAGIDVVAALLEEDVDVLRPAHVLVPELRVEILAEAGVPQPEVVYLADGDEVMVVHAARALDDLAEEEEVGRRVLDARAGREGQGLVLDQIDQLLEGPLAEQVEAFGLPHVGKTRGMAK